MPREETPGWSQVLRRRGRVEIGLRRGRVTTFALFGGLLVAVGAGLLVTAQSAGDVASGTAAACSGTLIVVVFGRMLLRRGPSVIVDETGLEAPHRRMELPWSVMEGAFVLRVGRRGSSVNVLVEQAFLEKYYATHRWPRFLLALNSKRRLPLPTLLAVDEQAFADWLDVEISRRR